MKNIISLSLTDYDNTLTYDDSFRICSNNIIVPNYKDTALIERFIKKVCGDENIYGPILQELGSCKTMSRDELETFLDYGISDYIPLLHSETSKNSLGVPVFNPKHSLDSVISKIITIDNYNRVNISNYKFKETEVLKKFLDARETVILDCVLNNLRYKSIDPLQIKKNPLLVTSPKNNVNYHITADEFMHCLGLYRRGIRSKEQPHFTKIIDDIISQWREIKRDIMAQYFHRCIITETGYVVPVFEDLLRYVYFQDQDDLKKWMVSQWDSYMIREGIKWQCYYTSSSKNNT